MNPKTVTALDDLPIISIEDCRAHLRVTPDDDSPPAHPDDSLILDKLASAREWIEGYTGLALTPRTMELALDRFPSHSHKEILLPGGPPVSVTSVKYYDTSGVLQTLDPTLYMIDTYQNPGWLFPAVGTSWPATKSTLINAVLIRYVIGFSFRTDSQQSNPLPRAFRSALLLLLGSLYENRENDGPVKLDEVPIGVKSLCDWDKVRKGMA